MKRAASNLTTRSLSDEKKKVKESSKLINETILKKNQEYLSIKQFINRYIDKIKQKLELRQNKHKRPRALACGRSYFNRGDRI